MRVEEVEFAQDSPLEEAGFEPSVPLVEAGGLCRTGGPKIDVCSTGGPRVRIRLPPARSRLRTWLPGAHPTNRCRATPHRNNNGRKADLREQRHRGGGYLSAGGSAFGSGRLFAFRSSFDVHCTALDNPAQAQSSSLGDLERLHVADGERTAQSLESERSDFPDVRYLGDCGCNSRSNQNLAILGGLA